MELFTVLERCDLVRSSFAELYKFISDHHKEQKIKNAEEDVADLYVISDDALAKLSDHIIKSKYSIEYTGEARLVSERKREEYIDDFLKQYPELKDNRTKLESAVNYYFDDLEKRLSDILSLGEKIIIKKVDDSTDEVIYTVKGTEKVISDKINTVISALNKITVQEADAEKDSVDTEESCINIYLNSNGKYYRLDKTKTNADLILWREKLEKHNKKINIITDDIDQLRKDLDVAVPNSEHAKRLYFSIKWIEDMSKTLSKMTEIALKDDNICKIIKSFEELLESCIDTACGANSGHTIDESSLAVYTYYNKEQIYFTFHVPKSSIGEEIISKLRIPAFIYLDEALPCINYPNIMERSILPNYLFYMATTYDDEIISKLSFFINWFISFK